MQDLCDQAVLHLKIRQHHFGPLGVELAGLRQGGQVHHRAGVPLAGGGEQGVILQGQQLTGGCDAIGERRHIAEVGQLLGQEAGLDKGIGVAIGEGGAQLFVEIGEDQQLSWTEDRIAAQRPVVLP